VCGHRFEAVARHIWALTPPAAGAIVLDIGTGTGIVPRALDARVGQLARVIGCDRSAGMLSLARATMPGLPVLAAEATLLPFRHSIFDVVTASFVLSHLLNYRAGLEEAYRVLKPSGIFVMTSWTANTDPYNKAWSELLAEAVSEGRLQEAVAQVAPSEGYFQKGENVKTALTEAGFARVDLHTMTVECSLSLDRFVADRELSSRGRFARDALGPERWGRFAANAREMLRRSFGPHFDYSRGVLIGRGHRV
jgi:ubiquinone/menaquinone biosynthesis C-methylase UbiE